MAGGSTSVGGSDAVGETTEPVTGVPSAHRWTDEDTRALILWRSENRHLFTGKRNASTEAYNVFLTENEIRGVQAKALKKRWENLVAKYKDLKKPRTGVSTEGGEATAASWKWYTLMDEALGDRRSITPPVVFASASREVAVASPSPAKEASATSLMNSPSTSTPTPKKPKLDRRTDILLAMKEQDRQQEEVLAQLQRDQLAREAREEARAKEAAAREERVATAMMEREERFFMEMRDREERLFTDMRAREDRRDREAAAREERLLAILERI